VIPCSAASKPGWLLERHAGKMPCLQHNGETLTESGDIARYLDREFPEPALLTGPNVDRISSDISAFFPALAKFVKCAEFDCGLEAGLLEEAGRVEAVLERGPGPWLAGPSLALPDLSLGPKLHHMQSTLAAFAPATLTRIETACPRLMQYTTDILAHPALTNCSYPAETVIWGWTQARNK